MAARYLRQFTMTQDAKQILIAGNISLAADASVAAKSFNSLVSSVTKSATGEYTIQLADKYQMIRSVQVTVEGLPAASAQVKSVDVTSAKTVVLNTIVAAAIADVSGACKLHVTIILNDSTVR